MIFHARNLIAECAPYKVYCDLISDSDKPFLVPCLTEAPIRFRSLGVITWGDLARSLGIEMIINISKNWEKIMCVSSLEITRKIEELNPSKKVKVKEHERKLAGELVQNSNPAIIEETHEPIETRFLDCAWDIASKMGVDTLQCNTVYDVAEAIIKSLE
jgi:hypothetical protein